MSRKYSLPSDLSTVPSFTMGAGKRPSYMQLLSTLIAICSLAVLGAAGCSSSVSTSDVAPVVAAPASDASSAPAPRNAADLEKIARERANDNFSPDFAVGSGDVLEVTVPDMPELKDQLVRVSASNTIALPMVGTISTANMTEQQVRDAVKQGLAKYMRDPQVDVFVKEYQSRMVAVEGMVQKPGLYSLTNRSDTVLDLISRAGGMLENASTRVIFIPVSSGHGDQQLRPINPADYAPPRPDDDSTRAVNGPERPAAPLRVSAHGETQFDRATKPEFGKQGAPIVINLATVSHESRLDVPVRPGDVIIVPAAGQVMVKGWVQNPGAFRIVPGMTVLGAVSAAGGEMFSSDAVVLRTSDDGQKTEIPVDLSTVQKGDQPDVLVQSGDVVVVRRSAVGAVPYAAYEVFNKFSTGVPIIW